MGKVTYHATLESKPKLVVVSFFVQMAKIGYPYTRKQVFVLVQRNIFDNNKWMVEKVFKLYPEMTFKAAVPLSITRAMASDTNVLDHYFNMLEECLHKNGIWNKPFNCDETGLASKMSQLTISRSM